MDGVWEEYGGGGTGGVVVFNRGKIVSAPAVQGGWGESESVHIVVPQ